ncbi:MAG: cupin domain-containing protein [Bryobacteraceae bacterium]
MPTHRWDAIPLEQMNPTFARKVIHTERMTIARVILAKGSVVPRHQHENEQVTLLEKGRLRFQFDDGDHILAAGESMQIPPNAPHLVEALEDSEAYDLFAPVRADWIRGDDSYLRR